jgi:hypothetical protein
MQPMMHILPTESIQASESESDRVRYLAVGEQVEEILNLARAVVMPGRPESTVRMLIKLDGLCVDVNIYSSAPEPVPASTHPYAANIPSLVEAPHMAFLRD